MGAVTKNGERQGIGAPSPQRASHRHGSRAPVAATLDADIAALQHLNLDGLRARWLKLRGSSAPASLRRDMLMRALAYEMQVAAHGGLPSPLKRRLRQLAEAAREDRFDEVLGVAHMKPGTLLVRKWQGRTQKVTVTVDGYTWNGEHFRSLSTVAKRITGTSWNGWTFFGLKRPTGRNKSAAKGRADRAVPAAGKPKPAICDASAKVGPRQVKGSDRQRSRKETADA